MMPVIQTEDARKYEIRVKWDEKHMKKGRTNERRTKERKMN
jgi:hypothetical protein